MVRTKYYSVFSSLSQISPVVSSSLHLSISLLLILLAIITVGESNGSKLTNNDDSTSSNNLRQINGVTSLNSPHTLNEWLFQDKSCYDNNTCDVSCNVL